MADTPGVLQGDYSQFINQEPFSSPYGELGRNWFGQLLGLGYVSERDDWKRSEQAADNAFVRDMYKLQEQNIFNANQAQIDRDWQKEMSDTAYQRAVSDMKIAGLNPALMYSSGSAASTGSGAVASSGSGSATHASYSSKDRSGSDIMSSIAKVIAGCISAGASEAVAGINAAASIANSSRPRSRRTVSYKSNGRRYTDSYSD